jgi:hypothetical protein
MENKVRFPGTNILVDERLSKRDRYNQAQEKWAAENKIVIGSVVYCLRIAETQENGWDTGWCIEMNNFVSKCGFVESIEKLSGILVNYNEQRFYFPFFVLEVISKNSGWEWLLERFPTISSFYLNEDQKKKILFICFDLNMVSYIYEFCWLIKREELENGR